MTRPLPLRHPTLVLVAALGLACAPSSDAPAAEAALSTGGAPAAAALPATSDRTLGTIRATVDGDPHTWYVVAGTSSGSPYASGGWHEPPSGGRMIAVGGFDTEEPPLDTFGRAGPDSPQDYGDYKGSVVGLLVSFKDAPAPVTIHFPSDDHGLTAAYYQPVAEVGNMETTYLLAEGVLEVTEVAIEGGHARLSGTFSGTFRSLQGGHSVVITDGTFEASDMPNTAELGG